MLPIVSQLFNPVQYCTCSTGSPRKNLIRTCIYVHVFLAVCIHSVQVYIVFVFLVSSNPLA